MKVWELMAELAKLPAGADVYIGAANYENVLMDFVHHENSVIVCLESSREAASELERRLNVRT